MELGLWVVVAAASVYLLIQLVGILVALRFDSRSYFSMEWRGSISSGARSALKFAVGVTDVALAAGFILWQGWLGIPLAIGGWLLLRVVTSGLTVGIFLPRADRDNGTHLRGTPIHPGPVTDPRERT